MPVVKSLEDLKRLKEEALTKRIAKTNTGRVHLTVAMGTCGIAAGARDTMKAILEAIERENLTHVVVTQTGCIGLCAWEPIVQVAIGDEPKIIYGKVSPERAWRIMREHIQAGRVIPEFVIPG
jgi:NADP-reducing hydrogenase subunit HndB